MSDRRERALRYLAIVLGLAGVILAIPGSLLILAADAVDDRRFGLKMRRTNWGMNPDG